MSDEAGADKNKEQPKPKRNLVGLLTLVVLLLNVGATAFVGLKVSQPPPPAQPAEPVYREGPPKVLPTAELPDFVVNLNEPSSTRYLKTQIKLELVDEASVPYFEAKKLQVRHEVLRYLSGLSLADTRGEKSKDVIAMNVLKRVTTIVGDDRVKALYFEEFVIQ